MKKILTFIFTLLISTLVFADGVKIGDKAAYFNLKDIDGNMVSLNDFKDAKGVVLTFTCNTCPYAIAYQDRLIDIDKKYKELGYPMVAINPNDPEVKPGDSPEAMYERAHEKGFTFPYLFDEGQKVYPEYGATRTPHIFLLENVGGEFIVRYIGAIDDNYADADAVKETYLEDAIDALLSGNSPVTSETKAIGCSIKTK